MINIVQDVLVAGVSTPGYHVVQSPTSGYHVVQSPTGPQGPPSRQDLAISLAGTLISNEKLGRWVIAGAATFTAADSYASADVAPTSAVVISITKNGAAFATATWAPGSTVGAVGFTASGAVAAGDILRAIAPSGADATFADSSLTLAGV